MCRPLFLLPPFSGEPVNHPAKLAIIVLAFLSGLLFAVPAPARGEPYYPDGAISVLSEYTDGSAASPRQVKWDIRTRDFDAYWTLAFSPGGSQDPLCRVTLSRGEDGLNIAWEGPGDRGKTRFSAMMVLPGFPAPCDILPSVTGDSTRTYRVKREAGGHGFVTTYRVVREEVTLQEATARGWVRALTEIQPPLSALRVVDSSGATVVMQLWDSHGSWWLYEESGSRRSWVVEPDK